MRKHVTVGQTLRECCIKPMQIHLVRHCSTEFNADGRLRGWMDPPLSMQGLKEARALARPSGALYCSDLLRARMTAVFLGTAAPKFELRPWHIGEFAGQKGVHEQLVELQKTNGTPPGGEPYIEFVERFLGFVCSLYEPSVLVTHFRNLKLMQAWVAADCEGLDWDVLLSNNVETGSTFAFDLRSDLILDLRSILFNTA